jgi:DNA/RNA-binding domain of Phe-tRNA-synthetase-like protein
VATFRIAPEVFARLPGLQVVAVVARGLACAAPDEVDREWAAAWSSVHAGFGHDNPQSHPHVAAWRVAMKGIGAPHKEFPTSVEALVRRALKRPEPFRVAPLVDAYNAISLRHVVPAGAFDLDGLEGDLELRLTRDGDTFHALDAEVPEPVAAGEVAYATGSHVVTRHLVWRQSRQAAIGGRTRDAVFVTELLAGQEALAPAVTAAYVDGLRRWFGAALSAAVLSARRPALALAAEPEP